MKLKPSLNKVPKHIGYIIDGNRRFAKRLMMKPWKGHELGAKKFEKLLEWCMTLGIKELTLYTFSIENFNRPKEEFDYLMSLFDKTFTEAKSNEKIHKNKIRISFIGRTYMFPEKVQKAMNELSSSTKDYNGLIVNFAMAYGGRAEIIDATKKIAQQVKEGKLNIEEINEEVFKKNIYMESEPDLIIRTSERRLSGFLLWQGTYAEIQFLPDVLWPEFTKEHFIQCIEDYMNRERRFGK